MYIYYFAKLKRVVTGEGKDDQMLLNLRILRVTALNH